MVGCCLGRGADCIFAYGPVDATAAPVNPDWFCLPGFTFLVPVHPGGPGESPGGHKMVVVVVIVYINMTVDANHSLTSSLCIADVITSVGTRSSVFS